jgi:hypothetical protein
VTALVDLLTPAGRRYLEHLADGHRREHELAEPDRLMRQPGGLAEAPEPVPLHRAGRDAREAPRCFRPVVGTGRATAAADTSAERKEQPPLNTTGTGSIRAAIRHIGPSPHNEYTWREDHLTVRSVRTFDGEWNVIVDRDAAGDGSQDGITLKAADARELARQLLSAADCEIAEGGSAYEHRLEEARRWFGREMNFASTDRRLEAEVDLGDPEDGTVTAEQYERAAQFIRCRRGACDGPDTGHEHVA